MEKKMYRLFILAVISIFFGCSAPRSGDSRPAPKPDEKKTGERKMEVKTELKEKDEERNGMKGDVESPEIPRKPKGTDSTTSGHRSEMEGTEDAE